MTSFVAVSITSWLIIKFRAKYYNFRTYQMNTIGDMVMYFFGTITAQGTITWGLIRDGTQCSHDDEEFHFTCLKVHITGTVTNHWEFWQPRGVLLLSFSSTHTTACSSRTSLSTTRLPRSTHWPIWPRVPTIK